MLPLPRDGPGKGRKMLAVQGPMVRFASRMRYGPRTVCYHNRDIRRYVHPQPQRPLRGCPLLRMLHNLKISSVFLSSVFLNRRELGNMKARIVVDLNNSAFGPDYKPELSRILRDLAGKLESDWFEDSSFRHPFRDINGTMVGNFSVSRRS